MNHKILSGEAFELIKAKLLTADGNLAKIKDRHYDRYNTQHMLQWRVDVARLLAYELHTRGGYVEQVKRIVRQAIDRMIKEANGRDRGCICTSQCEIASVCLEMGLEELAREVISYQCPSSPQGYRTPMPKPFGRVDILRTIAACRLPQAEVDDRPER
jgi:hypothetical protein